MRFVFDSCPHLAYIGACFLDIRVSLRASHASASLSALLSPRRYDNGVMGRCFFRSASSSVARSTTASLCTGWCSKRVPRRAPGDPPGSNRPRLGGCMTVHAFNVCCQGCGHDSCSVDRLILSLVCLLWGGCERPIIACEYCCVS